MLLMSLRSLKSPSILSKLTFAQRVPFIRILLLCQIHLRQTVNHSTRVLPYSFLSIPHIEAT